MSIKVSLKLNKINSRFGNILNNRGSNVSKMINSATNDNINTKK